jgi:MFS family permease
LTIESSGALAASPGSALARRPFLGWRIVGAAFLAQFLCNAVTLSAFSNFILPLSTSFSTSKDTIALGATLTIAVIGFTSPVVGRWVDRGHVRKLMTGGSVLSGVGLIAMSQTENLLTFTLLYAGLVCTGSALFGPLPSMTVVANWFIKRRGFALGLTFAGATVVSAVAPVAAQFLIDTSGWRSALLYFGVLVLLVGTPAFGLFVIGRPEEVGQLPDGEEPNEEPVEVASILSVQELSRQPLLWLIAIGFGLILTSPLVLLTLLVPYGVQLGFTAQEANAFLVAAMPFSLLGKVALGTLVDRAPAKPIIALVVVANVIAWLLLYSAPSYAVFVATGAVYGIGIGGVAPVNGVVVGRVFGRVNFGTASGLAGIAMIILLICATLMSALLQGADGEGYPMVFLAQMGLISLGGMLLLAIPIPGVDESADAPIAKPIGLER